eukprot:COSAG02_NODE_139_length_34376_cov_233.853663_12_plen_89_part_00
MTTARCCQNQAYRTISSINRSNTKLLAAVRNAIPVRSDPFWPFEYQLAGFVVARVALPHEECGGTIVATFPTCTSSGAGGQASCVAPD